MGVTLERVQFKFASIIGELCSEPDILSQFAVWVDLRLAEYKLKGSISLDCSGDTPDPVWLKGILSALLAKRLAKRRELSKHSGHGYGDSSPTSEMNYARMRSHHSNTESVHGEDSVVSVKDEPYDDGVYPVGLHAHEIGHSHRKRSAAESLGGDGDNGQADILYSHSLPKQSRSESNTNESLMSIIGSGGHQSNNAADFENITETIDLIGDNEDAGNAAPDAGDMSTSSFSHFDTAHSSFSPANTETGAFSTARYKPGIMEKQRAEQLGMVELHPGSQAYVDQETYQLAVNKCSLMWQNPRTERSENDPRDGKPAARFLLSRFFTKEQLLNGTVSRSSGDLQLVSLDKRIIGAIIDFCAAHSDSRRPEILKALRCVTTSLRHKAKFKEHSKSLMEIRNTGKYQESSDD